uniref:Uncharacterized protein TCIL3000_11_10150 n=1 Tax=Trypanosoma congolense (strain IL3000) TaxID=1068625 RepID=G0V1M2_TRYCI|nr:unnamed protein product [Trypanosoma congolense IL3000]
MPYGLNCRHFLQASAGFTVITFSFVFFSFLQLIRGRERRSPVRWMCSGVDVARDSSFLACISGFTARYVDGSLYGPPYVLRGNACCCFSTFDLGESQVPSWSVCYRFAATETTQLVVECYGRGAGGASELVGMCLVQGSELLAASTRDSTVTLLLRDNCRTKGEISFRVSMQKLFNLTLRTSRLSLEVGSLELPTVYVKLSADGCVPWDSGSCNCCARFTFSSVKSDVSHDIAPCWSLLPLLQWRSTLTGCAGYVNGEICTADGDIFGRFSVHFPAASVAAIMDGEVNCCFCFSEPVRLSRASQATVNCVGDMTLLTDCPIAPVGWQTTTGGAFSKSGMCFNRKHRCSAPGAAGCLPRGLYLLDGVVEQHRERLARVREELTWVRKAKEEVRLRLSAVEGKGAAITSEVMTVISLKKNLEEELNACLERQQALLNELSTIQHERSATKEAFLAQSKERARELRAYLEESTSMQNVLEGIKRAQSRLRMLVASESQLDGGLQRFVREQQELAVADVGVLDQVRRLRQRYVESNLLES